MKRKDFLTTSLIIGAIVTVKPSLASLLINDIDELKPLEIVGFNHLPSKNSRIMDNIVLHKAASRGGADHGWLKTHHSFSFANYYNPDRMHFGVLRVLNDDTIAGGEGFGTHPHDNMEIITIPLSGVLSHKDSMGNKGNILAGDIQVMSAGTGIQHSEYNGKENEESKLLQIWVFPNQKNVTPRYDQLTMNVEDRHNKFQQILSPSPDDAGVWIHQDAWFNMANLDENRSINYTLNKKENGVYLFVIEGNVTVEDQPLESRDGLGIWNRETFHIKADSHAQILLMEVPMKV